jgi:sigma-E factor negative regulatory protein RseB
VVVLLLMLAPALLVVTSAEARPQHGPAEPDVAGPPAVHSASVTGPPGGGQGITLLREAAEASQTVPYRGVQMISWWGQQGTTTMVVNVAHSPGDGTLLQMAGTGAQPAAATYVPDTRGIQEPGSAFGVTEEALGLLARNYQVVTRGTGSAGSRPAQIVEARRGDGTVAARFWLDQATKVPLRRELFDGHSRMINEDVFIDLDIGRSAVDGVLDGQAAPSRPWSDELTAADLTTMRARGWPLPDRLPGGLSLFEARQASTASGPVLQLGYSDGLSGVSLFIQRGGLPGTLAGYQKVDVAGHNVYKRDSVQQLLTWAGRGHVYTVIADAPGGTVDAVVGALPHDAAPGFWGRLCHGFARLASWADPFR